MSSNSAVKLRGFLDKAGVMVRERTRKLKLAIGRALRWLAGKLEQIPAHRLIPMSFALIILIGTLLLLLPISQRAGQPKTTFVQALFVATSATCVTGLSPFDTATHWTAFGQTVILLLIQTGALGAMTIVASLALSMRQRLGFRNLRIAQESTGYLNMGGTRDLLRISTIVTLSCEACGAFLLMFRFIPQFGFSEGLRQSVFTAVSAYCNAGFDILGRGDSLVMYAGDGYVCCVLSALIILGGLGFIVFTDIIAMVRERRRLRSLMMHTKIVCIASAVLLVIGTLFFFASENNGILKGMSFGDKLLISFFQSVCTRSAGFYTVSMSGVNSFTKLFFIILMFIGASPGSTGGGIKTTTITVLAATVICTLRGFDHPVINRRRITRQTINKALAISAVALFAVVIVAMVIILQMGDAVRPIDALYEATSAFGTVGVSADLTSRLPSFSMLMLVFTMFLGRIGPVSLSLAISSRGNTSENSEVYPDAVIIAG